MFGITHLKGERFHRSYLASVVEAGRSETAVFGMRMMWDTFGELDDLLQQAFPTLENQQQRLRCAFGNIRFIFLFRQDLVRQAVSLLKAKQGGLWHMGVDGVPIEQRPRKRPFEYDREEISRLIIEMDEHNKGWRSWFQNNSITPLQISYEDLAKDPTRELNHVLDYIEVPHAFGNGIQPRTIKMADDINQSWTERYKNEVRLDNICHPIGNSVET